MEDRYAFLAEWYDPSATLLRRYQLLYYPKDGSVEMFDVKNQRVFLRRTRYEGLQQQDLFVGSLVNVFSRQLKLVEYGDQYTANKLGSKKERTLAMVKPDALSRLGDILETIHTANLIVIKAKMTTLTLSQASDFYMEHQSKPFFSNLVQFMSSGPVVAMELMGDEAIGAWRRLLGPTDSATARQEAQGSVRARFGTDGTQNAGHGSDSVASAAREVEFFFPSTAGHGPSNTAQYTECTCCIIKPHALSQGLAGKVLNSISKAGFEISALQMNMVSELCSGPCLALEVRGSDTPKSFRDFCGPADPEIARHLRPETLRALYGKDKVQNAVHCTDLPDDALLEVQYFFKILDG
ncbi:nucleoside diphosphate kinase 7 isoform X2 [Gadus chalcogrammus]|uniref:nucleoside diphosphate kinase 7 isoform X2 n=1 Tax=Gadus chalcogrammus TaxID=1042646 RepID=UPI0024C4D54A|nr:nucleoside diphosphate kinase 7 isoform X2 [Gadus chalcogrammus]